MGFYDWLSIYAVVAGTASIGLSIWNLIRSERAFRAKKAARDKEERTEVRMTYFTPEVQKYLDELVNEIQFRG